MRETQTVNNAAIERKKVFCQFCMNSQFVLVLIPSNSGKDKQETRSEKI